MPIGDRITAVMEDVSTPEVRMISMACGQEVAESRERTPDRVTSHQEPRPHNAYKCANWISRLILKYFPSTPVESSLTPRGGFNLTTDAAATGNRVAICIFLNSTQFSSFDGKQLS